MPDTLQRFLIDKTLIRGERVQLEATWQALQATADYPPPLRQVLGEALAAVALLATTLKFKGSLILQINATAPVSLLVVQVSSENTVRGLARWNQTIPDDANYHDLFNEGRITITVETENNKERYQSIVALTGNSLAASLTAYFETSEQLRTRLWLAAGETNASGLLLQCLPNNELDHHIEADNEHWNRMLALSDTLRKSELLTLDNKTLLHRLYHEENLSYFKAKKISFKCTCSIAKIESMIISLGVKEAQHLIDSETQIKVDCDFCNQHYQLNQKDIDRLFKTVETTLHHQLH
ncbi:MAG: Hsp33 family molecular chaperone HslO [Cocleimonas sp.]|nr:Hsp33 family molecular chaperone HslO [Cocleimonas sp.]